MILTAEELASLTKRTRSDAQARALNAMGIPHKRRADGSIVVSRAHVDEWLGVKADKRADVFELNLEAVA